MSFVQRLRRFVTRVERGARYSVTLILAMFQTEQRRVVREALDFCRSLPRRLDQPLPAALLAMTPLATPQTLDNDTIRAIVDALTAFGAGRPLGICLRRSLARYYFLRQAGLPVTVNFGARRLGEGIGGHAWLTLNGEPYHEQPEHYLNYALMFTFPAGELPQTAASGPIGAFEERTASPHASKQAEEPGAPAVPTKLLSKETNS